MGKIARVPITNFYVGGDYSARLLFGADKIPLDLLVDTGSSALAIDAKKYKPTASDKLTKLAQSASYGDGSSWTGAVISTQVTVGNGAASVELTDANVAVAYRESNRMFNGCDGILGLAYAPLDDAYQMPDFSWKKRYPASQVLAGERETITPYLTQLEAEGVAFEVVSFLTRRSYKHLGGQGLDDPLNQGVMLIGGGVEATDLYFGSFQGVRVLADAWYNTNLKAIVVGQAGSIQVPSRPALGYPSNSIVDSGTNSLNFGPKLLQALFAKLPTAQAEMLSNAVLRGTIYTVDDIKLDQWPTLTFVLEGETGTPDAQIAVPPQNYWQVNAYQVGAVLPAITLGDDGMAILGLPMMNGYFTVFDGVADNHRGVVRFAHAK
jgi:hypothetical protein